MPNEKEVKEEQNEIDSSLKDDYDIMDAHAYEKALGELTENQKKEVRRLEFSQKTKRILASRVGYRCSNPSCSVKSTIGPGDDGKSIVLLGEAAHIIGAIQDGDDKLSPRADSTKSVRDIISLDNGIWLCRTCHKLVDSKTSTYTISKLKGWKKQAEAKQAKLLEEQPSTFVEDYIYPSIVVDKGISSNRFGTKEWCLLTYLMSASLGDKSSERNRFSFGFEKDGDGNNFYSDYQSWMSEHSIASKSSGINFNGYSQMCSNTLRTIVDNLAGLVKVNNYGLNYGDKFDEFVSKLFEDDDYALEKLIKQLSKV